MCGQALKLKTIYTIIGLGAVLWLHYGAETPKQMVISGGIALGCFTMFAIETVEERMNRMQATIERLWKRVEPSMFKDSDL